MAQTGQEGDLLVDVNVDELNRHWGKTLDNAHPFSDYGVCLYQSYELVKNFGLGVDEIGGRNANRLMPVPSVGRLGRMIEKTELTHRHGRMGRLRKVLETQGNGEMCHA